MADWTTRQIVEAARRGGRPVSQEYIRRLCAEGAIRATMPGRDWLIDEEAAERWLARWLGGEGRIRKR